MILRRCRKGRGAHEANPPLEDLTPGERLKVESDPDTRPGKLRKVGMDILVCTPEKLAECMARIIRG